MNCQFGVSRFIELRKSKVGQTYKFKLYKQKTEKEIENQFIRQLENKYIPLIAKQSEKEDWSILPVKYGYIEYVNKEKQILHILTNESDNISYYKDEKEKFKKGDFVVFRQYSKNIKGKKQICIVKIEKCEKQFIIKNFKNEIVVVTHVDKVKRLFLYALGERLPIGRISFDDTNIRPAIGDFLKKYYSTIKNKNNQKKLTALVVEKTNEQNTELIKTISGQLELKYKGKNSEDRKREPDFAFIGNCYVPKNILQQYNFTENCYVSAQAIYTGEGDKWKVYNILNCVT